MPLDILCIEDNASDFKLLERQLRKLALAAHCQRVDGAEALHAALAERAWDLVLSDYSVPGMYFTDTLKFFLRQYPGLPLVLVSGTIGEAKAQALVQLGAWGYCSKDRLFELGEVIEAVMARVRT